ncbi:MAG: chorismate mutase [Rickettsiales bacterium]
MSDTLNQLRASIDAIDDEIARLLIKRQGFVHQVGEWKKTSGDTGSFIRPDREAIMIRSVIQKFTGSEFSPAAAAQLWRVIIGAALCLESPLHVSVSSRHPAALTLVREYFGNFVPAMLRDDDEKIITDCLASPHTVGVVSTKPSAQDSDKPWWSSLTQYPQLKIFAKIPFVIFPDDAIADEAYLIGQVKPTPTGDDETVIVTDHFNIKKGFHADEEGCIGAYAVPARVK